MHRIRVLMYLANIKNSTMISPALVIWLQFLTQNNHDLKPLEFACLYLIKLVFISARGQIVKIQLITSL